MNKGGMFITFEGVDGCGKSTQVKKFVDYLFGLDKHNTVILTREPYKEVSIRKILRESSNPLEDAERLANLFVNDRKQHCEELILPSLEKGLFVVSDRFKLSTIAYQSAQGLPIEKMIAMHEGLPIPDITFIVDLPAELASQRMKKEAGRNEHKFEANVDFVRKIREMYLKAPSLLKNEKIIIIDGTRDVEGVFEQIKIAFEKEFLSPKETKRYDSMAEVPESIKRRLSNYFTSVGGDTFAITNLPSELTGGALARYSRAPTGMQLTLVNEFLDENGEPSQKKGTELMDRVLNAYGDDSVGELEGTHLGVENISQLMTKSIEDKRIGGSPIEQSTRYVKYDQKDSDGRWRYLRPKEILSTPFAKEFEEVNDRAFEVYSELIKRLSEYFKKQFPEEKFQIEVERNKQKVKIGKAELVGEAEEKAFKTGYGFTIRCAALDVGRCVLPAATLTHLGVFGNGRFFTNLITSLKSGELAEERERAPDIERELSKVIPTFIKRNREIPEIKSRNERMRLVAHQLFNEIKPEADSVTLVERADYLDEVVASVLFPYASISLKQIIKELKKHPESRKLDILDLYIGKRETRRDRTGRGFEAGYPITFDLVGCFAEYRDLERHRMVTQQKQILTTDLGFIMPAEVVEVGMGPQVEAVVKAMEELNNKLRNHGLVVASQYATLFNHRLRFMMGMNLREFQHLSELRTQPAGHFSYRAMTMEMAKQMQSNIHWAPKAFKFVDYSDPGNKISRAKEQSKISGKNLAKGVDGSLDF